MAAPAKITKAGSSAMSGAATVITEMMSSDDSSMFRRFPSPSARGRPVCSGSAKRSDARRGFGVCQLASGVASTSGRVSLSHRGHHLDAQLRCGAGHPVSLSNVGHEPREKTPDVRPPLDVGTTREDVRAP